jgi:hypothetical protein
LTAAELGFVYVVLSSLGPEQGEPCGSCLEWEIEGVHHADCSLARALALLDAEITRTVQT